jgi:hypothetical protein
MQEVKEMELIFHSKEDNLIIRNILTKEILLLVIDYLANLYFNMVLMIINM